MKTLKLILILALAAFTGSAFLFTSKSDDWGFWAHRRINRLAVFTLPADMAPFFKKNIEYITEHAVDPDKRRYATRHEAVRHYIDIDHWGTYPFEEVPRDWTEALMKYTDILVISPAGDSLHLFGKAVITEEGERWTYTGSDFPEADRFSISKSVYRTFFERQIMPQYYEDQWIVDCEALQLLLPFPLECKKVIGIDRFSGYGISPYNMLHVQNRLTRAFQSRNVDAILRISSELGHYIGDGHVPLHTTENYDGQLTNQKGIHAFWESRIPELFADEQYNYFVGPAEYIEHPKEFFWEVVLASHQLVDSVLQIERQLSNAFPKDRQYCYEERLGQTVRLECTEYAAAYQERLQGMVERRMRDAIHAIGSAWYTAWVDAGQPDLTALAAGRINQQDLEAEKELEKAFRQGKAKGRGHD